MLLAGITVTYVHVDLDIYVNLDLLNMPRKELPKHRKHNVKI